MKKKVSFAIPALLLTLVLTFAIVKSVYAWSASAAAGFIDSGSAPRTYADAYASNYGLSNGFWEVYVRVGSEKDKDGGWRFGNGGGVITAQAHLLNQNVSASAESIVNGHDANGEFQEEEDGDTHPGA